MPRALTMTLTTLALLALTLALAPAALAVPPLRYASPTGTPTNDCGTPVTACDIQTAINGNNANKPVAGQEVIVAPGTYHLTTTLKPAANQLYVHGAFGQPRPVLIATGFEALHPNGTVGHHFAYLEFDISVAGNDSINISGATLEQLLITGSGNGGMVCQCYDGVLRDSVIVNTGLANGAWGVNSNGGTTTETLRNDTLIATQFAGHAIDLAQNGAPNAMTADAKNVIAINLAGGNDVRAFGTPVTVTLANSDYASPVTASGAAVVSAGGNISTPPVFVNAAGDDFREHASSATVDHGTDDIANDGSLDFAGSPRLVGAHTDIGAFEFQPPHAIAAVAASPLSAPVTGVFGALQAKLIDSAGNPAYDVTVTFTAPPSGASGTFKGGVTTAKVIAGTDGIATAPAFTANTHAGAYAVTATAPGVLTPAQLALDNLPGAAVGLTLVPPTQSTPAGRAQAYSAVAIDSFGNTSPATGAHLTIAPNGSCQGVSCSALAPGAHTVTATFGALRATAHLTVTPLAPKLRLKLKRHRAVGISRRTRRGAITATCLAPTGEICSVAGRLTIRVHRHTTTLGTIKGRLRAGRSGALTITLSRTAAATLERNGTLSATAGLRVVDLSGRGSVAVGLTVKPVG